ncbi:hypothetical protein [Streptomyces glomeratus]|uniref:Uncharacterized protein n=1 Tax=Streptomyces glomeratus TaxID=284452 RepID=A0ABP6LNU2_9ACTN|nr:hypothetical protein [Streptomyces glomeratus]MCF1511931.1 hypothetical protein [Streptomyces glomeratus]
MTKLLQTITDRLLEKLVPGGTAHAVRCWKAGSKCIHGSCAGQSKYTQYRMNCDDGSYYYTFAHCGC